jgi:hypothetical protein
MKRLSMLAILAFARTTFAEPAPAKAPPADAKAAEALVQRDLVQPLAARDREQSHFSRASLPPQERRVRVVDDQPQKDVHGAAFFTFAVEARHGLQPVAGADASTWRATVTGCVYVDRGEVFVKVGDRYRPGAFLLGKNLKPVAGELCQAAPTG